MGERGGIVHSVGTLVGGTAFAQGLAVLALPLLTRLYTPAEFSVLAVYASILGIAAAVACLRLEIAIPLPERDEDAASLLMLALASGTGFSLLMGLLVLSFPGQIAALLHMPTVEPYLWLVPLGLWVASTYAAIQYWSTRKKRFSRIARTRMTQALGGTGVQLGAGALSAGPIGLLLGYMISGGAGVIGLARDAWRNDRSVLRAVTPRAMRKMLREYSRFPKYSTLEALANTAGIQAPVIIIAALAIGPEAGYLMLATRLMAAPMALLGGSIAQVYLAHAPEELRANRLGDFTTRILTGLVKTGVGPLLFAGIVAPQLAGLVFGEEWVRTGELVAWMTPWFVLQFLSSPVSMIMHVRGKQKLMLATMLIGGGVRVVALLVSQTFAPARLAEVYAISSAIVYFTYTIIFYRYGDVRLRGVGMILLKASLLPLVWLVAGAALAMILLIIK